MEQRITARSCSLQASPSRPNAPVGHACSASRTLVMPSWHIIVASSVDAFLYSPRSVSVGQDYLSPDEYTKASRPVLSQDHAATRFFHQHASNVLLGSGEEAPRFALCSTMPQLDIPSGGALGLYTAPRPNLSGSRLTFETHMPICITLTSFCRCCLELEQLILSILLIKLPAFPTPCSKLVRSRIAPARNRLMQTMI